MRGWHKHLLHFNWLWVLVLLTPASLYLLFLVRGSHILVFQVVTALTMIYLAMALLHHHVHKNLTLEITLEYVLTAALALIIVQSLLF